MTEKDFKNQPIKYQGETKDISVQNKCFVINNKAYHHLILASGIDLKNAEKNFWNDDLNKYLLVLSTLLYVYFPYSFSPIAPFLSSS